MHQTSCTQVISPEPIKGTIYANQNFEKCIHISITTTSQVSQVVGMAHWPFCYFGKYLIFCWLFVKTLTIEVKHAIVSFLHGTSKNPKYHVSGHSLEKIGLCLMKMSNQMLQNCYVHEKRKPMQFFSFFISLSANLILLKSEVCISITQIRH